MSVKSKHVTKDAAAKRVQAATAVINRARGFAGNHTLMIKQGGTERVQRKAEGTTHSLVQSENKGQSLHRKASHETAPSTVPPIVHEVLRSPGQPLDAATRSFMEPRFGHDFSRVRVHNNAQAVESAGAVNALAYTAGQNVVFGKGQYAPSSPQGQKLLAHELAHVVQQNGYEKIARKLDISEPGDRFEQEANQVARAVMQRKHVAEKYEAHEPRQTIGRLIIQRAVALTVDDYTALAEQMHKAMAGPGTDEEAIYVGLQKLEKDKVAVGKLKKAYKDKYKQDLEAEIRTEISGSKLGLALELMGIKDDPKKADMIGKPPATDDEYKAAAQKLNAAMKGKAIDKEAIYAALIPFNRVAAKLKKLADTYQNELKGGLTGKGLEQDIKDKMGGDERAYALYLLNAPPPAAAASTATVGAAGAEAHKGEIAGGKVSTHTGTHYTPIGGGAERTEGFSMGYKGGLASETRWLQFLWREIVVTHPTKGEYRLNKPISSSAKNGYKLTTDITKPDYNTDSASADSPFYEDGGNKSRTADAVTIFDQPNSAIGFVSAEFTGGATKVISRAHFNTFLIRDYKPLYHVYLQVEWAFNSPAVPTGVQKVISGGAADSLPKDMKARLVAQYPKFDYIK